ncbi:MAG: DUF1553 domain-containing protein [Planctomycetota bacterium]|nr:DUF1553 domain-containing protein [Planctomycetota bacterium]
MKCLCVPLLLFLLTPSYPLAGEVEYTRDIKPVLKAKCYSCHGALKQEAGLRVDTVALMKKGGDTGPAIDPDNLLESKVFARVSSDDPEIRMPPEGEPLSPEQLSRFRQWIEERAIAPTEEQPQADPNSHWAFQPLKKTDPPSITLHPIDGFVDAKLAEKRLKRSSRAEAVTLVRRLFLDLHGLFPTPEDLEHWVPLLSGDESRTLEATKKLVDELLASSRYGERWAQHWLDIVRYADTHGYEVNTPRPNAWPYRDYVIGAFNRDKPYDQFVKEQLVGDAMSVPAGTGFMVAAAALLPGQIGKDDASKRLARQDELHEIIVGTTATFLGLTVGCARCHDHKFDPISQKDYYSLQAFFAGVKYGDREIRDKEYVANVAKAEGLKPRLDALRNQLVAFQPLASTRRTIIIDDEDLDHVTLLAKKNGHGANPVGTSRGYKDDPGDDSHVGNLSRGRYTWWPNKTGQDVFTWNPKAVGRFRVWISWGVHGSGVHTHDARYILDLDGDLRTRSDQKEIAVADQYRFAGITEGDSEKKPLWSGLQDAGIHQLRKESRIVLRCGETKTGITADVLVFQEQPVREEQGTATQSTLPRLRKPVGFEHNIERFAPTQAKFLRFTSLATVNANEHEPCIDELQVFSTDPERGNVALVSNGAKPSSSGNYSTQGKHQLKHINDGRFGNNYSWISNDLGKGWVQLEFAKVENIDRIEWGRDRLGRFKDRLPIEYRIETSLDGKTWTLAAGSGDREPLGTPHDVTTALLRHNQGTSKAQLRKLAREIESFEDQVQQLRIPRKIFAGRFGEPQETFLLNRGDPEQPTDRLRPAVLSRIGQLSLPMNASDLERRTALSSWLASPNNPLTARVMVNRIWQYHFGTGLVETPSDFGLNGASASHPELLDWLAAEFIASGWSVKHMHRLILLSRTYQQASSVSPEVAESGASLDSENRLLWRFPSRRLEAEAIRDCILQVSGQLSLEKGGPGFDFFRSRGGLSGFPPVEKFSGKQLRRMIYSHKIRMEPVPIFGSFDCPDAGLPSPKRSQSTTAIQALSLFNSPFVLEQADAFARRLEKSARAREAGVQPLRSFPRETSRARVTDKAVSNKEYPIQRAFVVAFGRLPSRIELAAALQVVEEHGLTTLCRALFNSNEFLYLP